MSEAEGVRVLALYLPVVAALLAGLVRRPGPRVWAGCLLSVLWVATSLPVLARLNEGAGWWSFAQGGLRFCGMPLELYGGWVVFWGILPQVALNRVSIAWCVAAMAAVDGVTMPLGRAVVALSPRWLRGECLAVVLVLAPAVCVARWTAEERYLRLRAGIQVVTAGLLLLWLLPEVAFALRPGRGWEPLVEMTEWVRQAGVELACVLAVPGVSAVLEFAERGDGTPIPFDAPKRLVTSGVYRYCANPMQVSCALVMLVWAGLLRNGWVAVAAAVSVVYSAGIAAWDEGEDLQQRFGAEWVLYRAAVRNWRPRWRPYHAGPAARVYLARTCGPCGELRAWLASRDPVGIELVDAETLGRGAIRRMRYEPQDGSAAVEGVRALARALEHLHLGWGLCGAALRLPGVWWAGQGVMDACGFGPRVVGQASAESMADKPAGAVADSLRE